MFGYRGATYGWWQIVDSIQAQRSYGTFVKKIDSISSVNSDYVTQYQLSKAPFFLKLTSTASQTVTSNISTSAAKTAISFTPTINFTGDVPEVNYGFYVHGIFVLNGHTVPRSYSFGVSGNSKFLGNIGSKGPCLYK